jgi:flagellar hook-length control protein FliK
MNIALLQLTNQLQGRANTTNVQLKEQSNFTNYFDQAINFANSIENVSQQTVETEDVVVEEEVEETLKETDLNALLQELGIEMDLSQLFIMLNDETMIPVEDMLKDLSNLTEVIGLTEEQLTQMISQLLGQEVSNLTDAWSFIEQTPLLLNQLVSMLSGEQQNPLSDKETKQLVQLIKLVELVGQKTDTVFAQQTQLANLSDAVQKALATLQVQTTTTTTTSTVQSSTPFQQVLQQVTTVTTTESETSAPVIQQTTTQAKTVTVTLPAEKPAQSEALLREIQNVISRSQLSGQQGNLKLLLKLVPENLGQIRIEIMQKDGVLTARLLATSALGKELLDSNLNQLKASLGAQNIAMERIDIAQSLQQTDRNGREQHFFNQMFRQQEDVEEHDNDEEEEEEISFSDLLEQQEV